MIRLIRQYLTRRRLARLCKANIARIQNGPARDGWGRFIGKRKHA